MELFIGYLLLNVWMMIGYALIYVSNREPENMLEGIGASIFWPFILFVEMMGVIEKWIEKA